MRKYLTPLFATATFLWMSAGAYFLNKPIQERIAETVTVPNSDILLRQAVFYFQKGQTSPLTNASFLPYLKNLSDSLQCGSSQSLLIRCFYDDSETGITQNIKENKNIGQMRADSIRYILESMNASTDLIETESVKITDKKTVATSRFYPAELTVINNNIGLFPAANWYYTKNQTDFVRSDKIKAYVSCLKRFLSSTSVNYKVYVTNIVGVGEKKIVSESRLKNIEKYLVQEGLSRERFIFKTHYLKESISKNISALQNPYIVINLATP